MRKSICIFSVLLRSKYTHEINIEKEHISIFLSPSKSDRVNHAIECFIRGKSDVTAIVCVRRDTSTNPVVIGVVSPTQVEVVYPSKYLVKIVTNNNNGCKDSLHDDVVSFEKGKFFRKKVLKKAYRIRVKKNGPFNVGVDDFSQFQKRLLRSHAGEFGFVSPKMSSGKLPFVRGIMSLMGDKARDKSKDPRLLLRYTSCFIDLRVKNT